MWGGTGLQKKRKKHVAVILASSNSFDGFTDRGVLIYSDFKVGVNFCKEK